MLYERTRVVYCSHHFDFFPRRRSSFLLQNVVRPQTNWTTNWTGDWSQTVVDLENFWLVFSSKLILNLQVRCKRKAKNRKVVEEVMILHWM